MTREKVRLGRKLVTGQIVRIVEKEGRIHIQVRYPWVPFLWWTITAPHIDTYDGPLPMEFRSVEAAEEWIESRREVEKEADFIPRRAVLKQIDAR